MANGIYPNPMANANAIGQLIGGGIGLYSNYQQQQAAKERQSALAQQQVQALNLLGQSQSLIQSNPDEARNLFLQAYQLAPEFVNKAMTGLQSQQKALGGGEGMTPYQREQIRLKEQELAMKGQEAQRKEAAALTPQSVLKDAKESQLKAASFAYRMIDAGNQLDSFEKTEGFDPTGRGIRLIAEGGLIGEAANRFATPEEQQYAAAASDFVTAQLRKESGAAIGDQEFERKYREFFPVPGDSDKQIAAKADRRKKAIEAMRGESGQVFGALYGQEPASESSTDSVVFTSEQYGDVTEADIQETMKANNISREEVLRRLGAK